MLRLSDNGALALVIVARQWRKHNGLLRNQRPLSELKEASSGIKWTHESGWRMAWYRWGLRDKTMNVSLGTKLLKCPQRA